MTILATVTTLRCQTRGCRATVSGPPEQGNRKADRAAALAAQRAGWEQTVRDWHCPSHPQRDIAHGKLLVERARKSGLFATDPEAL
jgi:hypothetical protein